MRFLEVAITVRKIFLGRGGGWLVRLSRLVLRTLVIGAAAIEVFTILS